MINSMKGYQYIAQTLKGYGLTHVFYIEAMLRLTLRELNELGVQGIMAHTENAAGYMADGYARITQKPGVCAAQSIGAANLTGGLQEAWLANSPVIALTGKKTGLYQYRNSYQEADHRLFFESITKFNAELSEPAQLPYLLRQCFRECLTGKQKPVHLDLPNRMGRTIEVSDIKEPVFIEKQFTRHPVFRFTAQDELIKKAAHEINKAAKPVIVAGRGAIVSNAHDEIYELAQKANMPVATTPDGKTIIDEKDPLWAGIVGGYGMNCANKAVNQADLVVFIGSQTNDQTTLNWSVPNLYAKVIQIDIDECELGRNYPNTIGLLGDAKSVTSQLIAAVEKKCRREWLGEVACYVKETLEAFRPYLASSNMPIRPERLCAEIEKILPDDAILVADTGFSAIWSAAMIKMKKTQQYFRAAGSLGWAYPASLGVKCGAPNRPVVCFTGDGGMYYHMAEMETAVRYGINTITIINNNQALAQCSGELDLIHEMKPEKGAEFYTFTNVNFSSIAEAFGCFSIRVVRPEDIEPALVKAFASKKPAIIEVVTDSQAKVPNPMPEA